MSERKYPFRDDDGNIHWVNYVEMMDGMDSCGFLTLGDGTPCRRARDLEESPKPTPPAPLRAEHVSDSLGFVGKQLDERVKHLEWAKEKKGVTGIEFREDPTVPGFYQVVCNSQQSKLKYAETLEMFDQNSECGGSATLTAKDLADAAELVSRGR